MKTFKIDIQELVTVTIKGKNKNDALMKMSKMPKDKIHKVGKIQEWEFIPADDVNEDEEFGFVNPSSIIEVNQ